VDVQGQLIAEEKVKRVQHLKCKKSANKDLRIVGRLCCEKIGWKKATL